VDLLHVERSKTLWDLAIKERVTIIVVTKIHEIEVGVVNLDARGTNIRDIQEKRSASRHLRYGRALVHRTLGGGGIRGVIHHHKCVIGKVVGINPWAPGYNGSIFCHKDESCTALCTLCLERKSRGPRENH